MDSRPHTIFCDLDGVLVRHQKPSQIQKGTDLEVLEGTIETLEGWDRNGYFIILTTGRKPSMRRVTEEQLERAGIFYDLLIMGVGGGKRILINDRKANSTADTAFSISLDRDQGVAHADLP